MSNPVVAHTFDFVRVYLSTRTSGAPGSGVWTDPVIIFDGTSYPALAECRTFSAGSLLSGDPYGIVGEDQDRDLMFLGDGSPAVPTVITYPGQIGPIKASGYWDLSQGAIYFDGSYYLPFFGGGALPLVILTSTDGVLWTECDALNEPLAADGAIVAMQRVDDSLYFFISLDNSDTNWSILPFSMTTKTYGAPFAPVTMAIDSLGSNVGTTLWGNGLLIFPNGDAAIVYGVFPLAIFCRIWVQATDTWGAPIALSGQGIGTVVMDPSFAGFHVLTYVNGGSPKGSAVNYQFVAYPSGTVTTVLNAIPAPVAPGDGVGHSSIQNGILFVPRDDGADFTNAVWAATLPVSAFLEEPLPVPPQEEGRVNGVTFNSDGSGYVVGDHIQIDGGALPAILAVSVTGAGGSVIGGTIFSAGAGYSIGSGSPTTAITGIGTGATVNITVVTGKGPSCAYMMFPNGYSLTITPLSLACPVGGGTATVGVPYSKFLVRTGGVAPFTFAFISGQASWMTLDSATGEITGTPDVAGTINYSAMVRDSLGDVATT